MQILSFPSDNAIPVLRNILNRIDKNSIITLKEIGKNEVVKEIKNLDIKIGFLSSNISTKVIKKFDDLFAVFITKSFNLQLNEAEILEILKTAEVTPNYKKANPFEKDNYRQISILSNISQNYERLCIIK